MMQQIKLILAAVQFFTRIPVPGWVGHTVQPLHQAARYFPLVGMLVGGVAALAWWLAVQVLPLGIAAVLAMAASMLLTGALHEDGLSDYADGIGGGYTREKILAIMKDARVGVYGVIALLLVLLLKYQALLELAQRHGMLKACAALVMAHTLSRLLALSVMLTQRYVREDETARARPVAQSISLSSFSFALLTGMGAVWLGYQAGYNIFNLISMLYISGLLLLVLAVQMRQKLGGYTGDCLGAVQQITEVGLYLGLLFSH